MVVSELLWTVRMLVLLQMVTGILGWGKEGHYVTCKIAEGYPTAETLASVNKLLPESAKGDLANVCSWLMRSDSTITGVVLYTMLILQISGVTMDIVGIVMTLLDVRIDESLEQFITIHTNFHQHIRIPIQSQTPLHVGFLGDLGGNTIHVHWYHRKSNLHHVWDSMIIESALKTFYGSDLATMIQVIKNNITENWSNQQPLWEHCEHNRTVCPYPYASESISLACKFAYRNATPGSTLEDDYFLSRLPIVEKRLAQGGVRLAATLNRIFASQMRIAQA